MAGLITVFRIFGEGTIEDGLYFRRNSWHRRRRRMDLHGSFRPAQVLLYKDQIGFIDFDSICQSEPGNDLALFLSSVMSFAMTNTDFDETSDSGAGMDEETRQTRFEIGMSLSEQFLDEYEKHRPISRQRVALWEALDLFMLVLHGWIKVKVGELNDTVYLMERFLQTKKYIGTP